MKKIVIASAAVLPLASSAAPSPMSPPLSWAPSSSRSSEPRQRQAGAGRPCLHGCVIQAGLGQNVARQASLKAGLPIETPAVTVNVVCGSGLNCVNMAAQMIEAGDADIVVAGGMENMDMAPFAMMKGRYGTAWAPPWARASWSTRWSTTLCGMPPVQHAHGHAHKRLVEIQKEIPKIMVPFSVELDIKGVIDNLKANMEGLSFEECVIRLTQMFVFEKQEDIKKRVIEEFKDNPISHLFGKSLINAQGQTVLALHPLDIHDPEKRSETYGATYVSKCIGKTKSCW